MQSDKILDLLTEELTGWQICVGVQFFLLVWMLSYEGTDFGCRSGTNILMISGLVGSQFFPTGTKQDRRKSHINQDSKVSAFVWVISTFTELTKI